jgi:hypothetical protein
VKKSFPLAIEGRKPELVLDAIKHELRKYLKRERRKPLPEGVDFWDFDCRVGGDAASAGPVHPADLEKAVGDARQSGSPQVYVEILAKPGHRTKKASEDEG